MLRCEDQSARGPIDGGVGGAGPRLPRKMTFVPVVGGGLRLARNVTLFLVGGGGGQRLRDLPLYVRPSSGRGEPL